MVVRIHNIAKWAMIPAGQVLKLSGEHRRKVRVEVNCEAPTRLDVIEGEDEGEKGTFLAVVQGYEVLEFVVSGVARLVPTTEGEVWYFTNDGDQIAADMPELESFTKIASRRARNPELEMMMFKMNQNMERRLATQAAEIEALREAQAAAEVPHNPETGEVIEDGEVGAGNDPGTAGAPAGGEGVIAEPPAAGQVASAKPGAGIPAGPASA